MNNWTMEESHARLVNACNGFLALSHPLQGTFIKLLPIIKHLFWLTSSFFCGHVEGFAWFMPGESGQLWREAEELLHRAHTCRRGDTLLFGRKWVLWCSRQGWPLDSHLDQGWWSYHFASRNLPPFHSWHQ